MIRAKHTIALALVSTLALTACTDPGSIDRNNDYQKTKRGAAIGGVLGGIFGAATGGDGHKSVVRGVLAGAAVGGLIGNSLDKQEADLRRNLGNDNVSIVNTGDRLIVTMPQDILFDVDSAELRPTLRRDLRAVGAHLLQYPNSTVQVIGHTDNTGGAAYNQTLSNSRANAVADVLMNSGVPLHRIRAFGRGEDQPVASNLTPEGRNQNRRVEIIILPNA